MLLYIFRTASVAQLAGRVQAPAIVLTLFTQSVDAAIPAMETAVGDPPIAARVRRDAVALDLPADGRSVIANHAGNPCVRLLSVQSVLDDPSFFKTHVPGHAFTSTSYESTSTLVRTD